MDAIIIDSSRLTSASAAAKDRMNFGVARFGGTSGSRKIGSLSDNGPGLLMAAGLANQQGHSCQRQQTCRQTAVDQPLQGCTAVRAHHDEITLLRPGRLCDGRCRVVTMSKQAS